MGLLIEKIKKDDRLTKVGKSIYTQPWFVYIVQCQDKTLYVGIARDVLKRIRAHNTTNRCRYTRFRKPIVLLYKEVCENYNIARKKESELKRFSRKKKIALIDSI